MIVVAAIFLILPMLIALHLYTTGGFTNRRAFQYVFFTLLALFALTIALVIHDSYGFPLTAPVSLTEASAISSVGVS
jgi:hypothetical protein